jgi:catechol 2,3-dioxygenase-like lactoylglutathione lyase family enzyme
MKRLHINLSVADLDASIRFYSTLFATEPTVMKKDYAKWMLEDPRVNFSLSHCGQGAGIDHLGIQADDEEELAEVFGRLEAAGTHVLDEGETTCCYARSTKKWITDPQGVTWETFLTHGASDSYGSERPQVDGEPAACNCGS